MKFSELVKDIGMNPRTDFEVAGIATDSRKVKEDFIFVALKGEKFDGSEYIEDAVKNGAKAVFSESPVKLNNVNITSASISQIKDVHIKLLKLVSKLYSPLPENFIGVTGTNGKTSVANFTAGLLSMLGEKSASVGTLGTLIDGDFEKMFSSSGLTTPDIITLYHDLNGLKKQGIDWVAMEASSHGLFQKRLGEIKYKTAAFTNFTQDHLDYHLTMEEYFNAKMILFKDHMEADGAAIINADIPEFEKIKKIAEEKKLKIFSFGKNGKEIKIKAIRPHDKGLNIEAEILGRNHNIETSLIGAFQAYNVVCAIGLLASLGFDIEKIVQAAKNLKPVKGRMDVIEAQAINPSRQNAKIVIDYAHTPDALEKAIDSLRTHTSGRLITMFGCGGDRDKAKRPIMGKIASEKSDIVIVTDDNPRTEVDTKIRKEILTATTNAIEVPDRRKAIRHGISLLRNGDSLLLAGKGHEDYQIIGKEKLPFDEFKIVKDILGEKN